MKLCAKCQINKNEIEFYKNKNKKDGLSTYCKKCQSKCQSKWYDSNSAIHKENVKAPRSEARIKMREWYSNEKSKPCLDCGKQYHFSLMEYDHVDDNKKHNIAFLAGSRTRIDVVKKEIEKCELVCALCHRVRTWNRKHPNDTIKAISD